MFKMSSRSFLMKIVSNKIIINFNVELEDIKSKKLEKILKEKIREME